jgi:hypothetical protein
MDPILLNRFSDLERKINGVAARITDSFNGDLSVLSVTATGQILGENVLAYNSGFFSNQLSSSDKFYDNTSTYPITLNSSLSPASGSINIGSASSRFNEIVGDVGIYNTVETPEINNPTAGLSFKSFDVSFMFANNFEVMWYQPLRTSTNNRAFGNSTNGWRVFYTSLNITSDKRKKKDIEECDLDLTCLKKLSVKKYRMKNDEENKIQYGLLAQDIEETMPELEGIFYEKHDAYTNQETKEEIDETYTVSYVSMIPVLIKSIQQLSNQVDELTNRIIDLESENKRARKI